MRIRATIGAGIIAALAIGIALPTYATPQGVPHAERPAAASSRAEQALAHVQALFHGGHPGNARATVHPNRDATLALRDLVRLRGQLRGTAARQADRLLARPASSVHTCAGPICVHWSNAIVGQRDDNQNSIPDYIDDVVTTVSEVHQQYVDAGYRAPRPDGRRGGNNKTDIYIRNIGAQGIYGYCTTEKQFRASGPFDSWAYCVLDNNYAEFPARTRLENLQVTAAHEYFHAVQFAYDAFEDSWFMEATATWAEDEIYDDINDNLQYLRRGPLRRPRVPLDRFEAGGTHQYGDWIYFRYLTEQLPTGVVMPDLVRQMWERADGSAGGPDMYSLQAIRAALTADGQSFGQLFARFADANRRPADVYEEGAANSYPRAPLSGSRLLGPGQSSGWMARELDHLSSTSLQFTATGPVPPTAMRVSLNMADKSRGSLAIVTPYVGDVAGTPAFVSLDRIGVGALTVPFSGSVTRIEVTLVNASARTRCWRRASSPYSCFGVPRDDNLTQRVRVVAVP